MAARQTPRASPFAVCPDVLHERVFRRIVAEIFATTGLLRHGSIIDAGANNGQEACYYAALQPNRSVHAIEPLQQNVDFMLARYQPSHPNLRPLLGGLGSENTVVSIKSNM